ncbi:hypothetical protein CDAR_214531 [Caerostris darwini]|uniref:Uncharacterized protein n=1 Tax=Caerostris darwini TaxID=1538125 RepID=A0AAV4QLQ1_9ARAC|nr:hypothetical protein CDAR_214531 [Caerostris darwini]
MVRRSTLTYYTQAESSRCCSGTPGMNCPSNLDCPPDSTRVSFICVALWKDIHQDSCSNRILLEFPSSVLLSGKIAIKIRVRTVYVSVVYHLKREKSVEIICQQTHLTVAWSRRSENNSWGKILLPTLWTRMIRFQLTGQIKAHSLNPEFPRTFDGKSKNKSLFRVTDNNGFAFSATYLAFELGRLTTRPRIIKAALFPKRPRVSY